jgi:hypothetical protein
MHSRIRRGAASGPAEWLLTFLQARDVPPRAQLGVGAGPSDWLLVFLDAASAGTARPAEVAAVHKSFQPEMEAEPHAVRYVMSGA